MPEIAEIASNSELEFLVIYLILVHVVFLYANFCSPLNSVSFPINLVVTQICVHIFSCSSEGWLSVPVQVIAWSDSSLNDL